MAAKKATSKEPGGRKRAAGGGRKKSTPLRQHMAGMQPCRRSEPLPSTDANAPLAGEAPAELGEYGRFLWSLLTAQQADAAEKGVTPAVTMQSAALALAYCSAFDRWAEAKKTIRYLEADRPPEERHLAKWDVDDDGVWHLHGVWQAEMKFRKEAIVAARALGIGSTHPTTALQVNINGQQVAADPSLRLIGPYRESAKTIDAVAD